MSEAEKLVSYQTVQVQQGDEEPTAVMTNQKESTGRLWKLAVSGSVVLLLLLFGSVFRGHTSVSKDSLPLMGGSFDDYGHVYDVSYSFVGLVDDNGRIFDGPYSYVGRIKNDGRIYDGSYSYVGLVDDDGRIYDRSYSRVGLVDDNGYIRDASYSRVGRFEGLDKIYAGGAAFLLLFD